MLWADNSVKHWGNLSISNPSMHPLSLVKILLSRNENMAVSWADNAIKIWWNSTISNPKPDFLNIVSMHELNLVKITWYLLKLWSRNDIWAFLWQITPLKFDKICPLAIPSQISTISMHIPSLVKIHWYLLKLSVGNEIWTDKHTSDGRTHRHPTWNHNTLPLSCGGV